MKSRAGCFAVQGAPLSKLPRPRPRPLLKQQHSKPWLWLPNNMHQDFCGESQVKHRPVVPFTDTVGAGYVVDAESFYLEPNESKVDVWHFI